MDFQSTTLTFLWDETFNANGSTCVAHEEAAAQALEWSDFNLEDVLRGNT